MSNEANIQLSQRPAFRHSRRELPSPKGDLFWGHIRKISPDPLGFFKQCVREHGDLVALRIGPLPALLLNHPDYIEEALVTKGQQFMRKSRLFRRSTKRLLGNGLFNSEGDFYHRQRRLAQPAFHRERIVTYGKLMVAETNQMLIRWQNGDSRDVYPDMMSLTLSIVAKTMLGANIDTAITHDVGAALEAAMNHTLVQASTFALIPEWLPTPDNLRFRRTIRKLDKIVYGLIEERRASCGDSDDLLSMLLQAQDTDGSRMSSKQLRDEVTNIFLAGHETTAISLTWIWFLLSEHPEVEAKLIEELRTVLGGRPPEVADLPRLRYTESVALEALRLYPPVWFTSRMAIENTEIAGYSVPENSVVIMCQLLAHRDPRYFNQPEAFKPDRWANDLQKQLPVGAYFPFSLGSRICLGKAFGMMEIVLLLATIGQQFKLTLAPGYPVELWPSLTLRPKYGMKMQLSKR